MWRALLILVSFIGLPAPVQAQPAPPVLSWETCRGAPDAGAGAPLLTDCRPAGDVIDPQGRELWLRSVIEQPEDGPARALYIAGVASSQAWLNGRLLGANGRPGGSADTETPGRYQIALPIADTRWEPGGNALIVHMSSFHSELRLDRPIGALQVGPYPLAPRYEVLAVIFVAAGALFAGAFGFGVIHSLRRTSSSLTLALMSSIAAFQAVVESLRALVAYTYPFHVWRLVGIWFLCAAFAILLVFYVVSRFWPSARRAVVAAAVVAIAATSLAPGFDLKTGLALMIGVAIALVVAAIGVRRRAPAARPTLAYLAAFLALGAFLPQWLLDLSYFLFAAGLILPLLMAEVVRLGRDDRDREAALIRAADRPNCLTVATSRRVERVPLDAIAAVVGADDYVELRLADGRRLLHAARLDRLETDLPPGFLRIHRSIIANLAHVSRLENDGGRWRLVTIQAEVLPVSRSRLAGLRAAMDDATLDAALARA